MPNIDEIFDKFGKCNYFTTIVFDSVFLFAENSKISGFSMN